MHDVVLESKDVQFFTVEELPGRRPTRLRISGLAFKSAMSVNKITTKRDSGSGQTEIECCASPDFSIGPGFATVSGNDPSDACQADARSLEVVLIVQTLKDPKQLVCVSGIEPNTVVTHKEDCFTGIVLKDADFDFCRVAESAVLQGVGDEIHYYLSQQG